MFAAPDFKIIAEIILFLLLKRLGLGKKCFGGDDTLLMSLCKISYHYISEVSNFSIIVDRLQKKNMLQYIPHASILYKLSAFVLKINFYFTLLFSYVSFLYLEDGKYLKL
jgi:hypothetical protein